MSKEKQNNTPAKNQYANSELKQIEEMAEVIDEVGEYIILGITDCVIKTKLANNRTAKAPYNAGYRKQSEGRWEGNGYLKNCSECGNVVNFNNVSQWLYKFCPNCGTKMKGGAE